MQHATATFQKLLALHSSLFDLQEYDQIIDFIVNDSYKIIPYQIAVAFEYNSNNIKNLKIIEISGIINQEVNNDFKLWLTNIIEYFIESRNNLDKQNTANKLIVIHQEDLDSNTKDNWAENLGQEILLSKLYTNENDNIGLIVFNDTKYNDNDIISFNFLLKSYEQALTINLKQQYRIKRRLFRPGLIVKLFILGFVLSMFIPVTPSVMGPAEVISEKTWAINSPISGIVKKVSVEPNTMVEKDALLLTFDQLDLRNNLKVKQQELIILQTDQQQAKALGFEDLQERAKIFRLKQDIEAKKQEIQYAKEQLNLSLIKSPEKGIILFKSTNDLIGKPVTAGETVMQLADTDSRVIEIWLDINDSIKLEKNMKVYYYSNKEPFVAIPAKLDYYSYEAYITPQEKVAYRLIAKITGNNKRNKNNSSNIIIGDHGQIKIYGLKKISLGEFLFQKPIATLRQWFYKVV